MVHLDNLQADTRIWQPVVRRIGDQKLPSATWYHVTHVVKEGDYFFFITLVNEEGRDFTIAIRSLTGALDLFYENEFDAVRACVMKNFDPSTRELKSTWLLKLGFVTAVIVSLFYTFVRTG